VIRDGLAGDTTSSNIDRSDIAINGSRRLWRIVMINVLVVAEPALFRRSLAQALSGEHDLAIVGQLDRADDVVGLVGRSGAQVVIVDIDPDATGLDQVQRLSEHLPECPVIVLASDPSPRVLRRVIGSRIRGLVTKDNRIKQLTQAVRRVVAGERVIEPTRAVVSLLRAGNPLTNREVDVLRLFAEGLPIADIARDLQLAPATVRNYLSIIIRKTGSQSRVEAINAADRAGWM